MQTLIQNVLQWGRNKQIIGENGKGTVTGQAEKMMEEATETWDAVHNQKNSGGKTYLPDIKDGIGDTVVTLILLAEMHGWTLEECLQVAYDEIKGRTGQMVDGVFLKDGKEGQ